MSQDQSQESPEEILKKLVASGLSPEVFKKVQQEHTEQQKKTKKQKEEERKEKSEKWNNFVKAEKVLLETDMKFHRDAQPRYFRKLTTTSKNKKTGVEYINTEIKFYPPASLKEKWIELDNDGARRMFRIMVEGGEINVVNDDTGEFVSNTYQPRVFDKLTNTLKEVDEKTYNLLDLSDRIFPQEVTEAECPIVIKAMMYSLSGNTITWNEELKQWDCDKPENLEWLEKWIYGTVYADIGNSMASFPVWFGSGKVAKNAVADGIIPQILGKEACFTGTWDLFHGNFDGYKLGKVFMFMDEIPEKGSWSTIKNWTGSTDSYVKQKYGSEFQIENTIRYAIGTNSDTYPLPVEDGPQMMRVSPIKTVKTSTAAENVYKMIDQEYGVGGCRLMLKEHDSTLDVDIMTDFEVGDALMRDKLHSTWAGRDAAQVFLNYLHKTYKSESGSYSLPPLRGQDWQEIMEAKAPSVNQLVEYIIEEGIEAISSTEAFELYKVLQQSRSGGQSTYNMTQNGFAQRFKTLICERGYHQHRKVIIGDKSQVTMYTKELDFNFNSYEENIDDYIVEKKMGNGLQATTYRTLKHGINKKPETHTDIKRFLNRMK